MTYILEGHLLIYVYIIYMYVCTQVDIQYLCQYGRISPGAEEGRRGMRINWVGDTHKCWTKP